MASQQRTASNGEARGESWGGRRRRRHAFQALLAALVMVVAPFVAPGPASAGVGPSVTPSFPETTTVGDQFVGSVFIGNASTPPNTVNPITVTSLTLAPGCSVNGAPNCAGGVDAGVFTLGPVGTGTGACAGILFGIVQTSPGLYTFTPSAPVVLAVGQQCRIDFNVQTTRVPSVDVAPGIPGVQTLVIATVGVTSPDVPGNVFIATGGQLVTVLAAPALIDTTAAPSRVDVNEGFSDLATVSGVPGGPTPTGTVTFQLYGPTSPGFPTCTGTPVFTSAPIPLTATSPNTATAGSGTVTTANPGNYVFVATYNPAAGSSYTAVTSPCDEADERVTVEALPTILVDKTATPLTMVEPGGTFTFNVVVTNTSNEPLTLTTLNDDVYGPLNGRGTCATGATLAANGGTYSCSFQGQFTGLAPAAQTDIVTAIGTDSDGNTATDNDDAIVRLTPSLPVIVVDKTATPLSRPEPGGVFTFNVVVTNNSVRPVTLTTLDDDVYGPLNGRGTCALGASLAASGGTYSCSFTGPFTGDGGDRQVDVVTATAVDIFGNPATDSDDAEVFLTDVAPTVLVDKTATPASRPEPGGDFTFNVVVTNTSNEPVTITSLTDDIYGNLATRPGTNTCGTSIGTVLAASPGPGNTYTCSFVGPFSGGGGDAQTDIVTAVVADNEGTTATDNDDATVTLTDVAPTVLVDKTATPSSRPEPGGTFTFNVVVTNTSSEPVTITTLTDDIYGNLATRPGVNTCTTSIGTVLAANGGSYTCSFEGNFSGGAGAAQTDIVTSTVVDDEGTTATDSDDAVVTLTDVAPVIRVDKTATPLTRLEPGGDFTFNVVVTNLSPESVTITTLTDDIYGNLATRPGTNSCTTSIGTILAANGGSYSCSFVGPFFGPAGAQQTDVVTATAVDDDGTTATDNDDAIVAITNVVPTIIVDKTATPDSLPEPGGTFTFNVTVTNASIEPVTITSLTDDIYGNLVTRPGSTCATALGTVLAANGGSYSCSFTGPFNGDAGATQTDVVTATAVDDDGTVVTDDDDAIVTITDVAPTIDVVKTATPLTMPEPGGTFTFDVVVTNTSGENLTITTLIDNIYMNIATQGTCTNAIGTVLAPGASYSCEFEGDFIGDAGETQTDVVTVTGVDNEGNVVTDFDDAVVALTDVPPEVAVVKTADPESLPEPGGTFTYTVVVTNTGTELVFISELTDDVYGDISTQGTCIDAVGTLLDPGESFTCEFEGNFEGVAGDTETDTVTVIVEDDDGTEATDDDDATVTITEPPSPPTVEVVKTATPGSLPAPGGTFTFNVVVTNTSAGNVTITTLTDDIYGNIATQGTCTSAIGTVLEPDETYSCSFTGAFTGASGSQTDVVTVVVTDEDGQTATDSDDAVVTITPAPVTPPRVVEQQNVTRTVTETITRTTTLPKTGAGATDLLALAVSLIGLGGLLLLGSSRWGATQAAAGGVEWARSHRSRPPT